MLLFAEQFAFTCHMRTNCSIGFRRRDSLMARKIFSFVEKRNVEGKILDDYDVSKQIKQCNTIDQILLTVICLRNDVDCRREW